MLDVRLVREYTLLRGLYPQHLREISRGFPLLRLSFAQESRQSYNLSVNGLFSNCAWLAILVCHLY